MSWLTSGAEVIAIEDGDGVGIAEAAASVGEVTFRSLEGFVSNKTKRKFKAYLKSDPKEGKVGFEFEPRKPRPPAKTAAAKTTPAAGKAARKTPATKRGKGS